MTNRFNFADRLRSFRFAWAGLRHLLSSEHNARIHLVASVAVIGLGMLLDLSLNEWRWLIVAISLVWIAEAFNTALERLGDAVSLEHDPNIGKAKDVAATAVMLSSLASALIGLTVFAPHLVRWLAD